MNKIDLKYITENLIETFDKAGKESIDLYKKGLKIELAISTAMAAPLPAKPKVEDDKPSSV